MTTTRVLLVRHGEPQGDSRGRCYGRLDVPLAARGLAQSTSLASALASTPIEAVYTSPRRRSASTAAALCATRACVPVADERLVELDFGTFEGRTYAEIEREHPELFRQWMVAPTSVRFPGGESWRDLRARVRGALDAIRSEHEDATVAVVAHGGVVRAAVADALSLPDERIFALDVGYCRVAVVDWFGDDAVVRALNVGGEDVPEALGAR